MTLKLFPKRSHISSKNSSRLWQLGDEKLNDDKIQSNSTERNQHKGVVADFGTTVQGFFFFLTAIGIWMMYTLKSGISVCI